MHKTKSTEMPMLKFMKGAKPKKKGKSKAKKHNPGSHSY